MTQPPESFDVSITLLEDIERYLASGVVTPQVCLNLAARLVKEAAAQLDTSATKCVACGLNHFADYEQQNANKTLGGIVKRLRRLARENPWTPDTQ